MVLPPTTTSDPTPEVTLNPVPDPGGPVKLYLLFSNRESVTNKAVSPDRPIVRTGRREGTEEEEE